MTLITLSKWSIQAGGILGVDADEGVLLDTMGWLQALPRLSQEQG